MTTNRQFSLFDLYKFNAVNLDILTETYSIAFYGEYVAKWNEYNYAAVDFTGQIEGYILGKVEGTQVDSAKDEEIGQRKDWHGHVTAVTVSPYFRKQGLARSFMDLLETVSEAEHNAFFVDLFVRSQNEVAITMYKNLGYDVYRVIRKYYSQDGDQPAEDAFDMRKSLKRDPEKKLQQPTGKTIKPDEIEYI